MDNKIISLNDMNFKQVIMKSNENVLVDFWAEWCNPCKTMASILKEIYQKYKKKLVFAEINIQKNPLITKKFSIRNIPTLIIFKKKKEEIIPISRKVGLLSKNELIKFIDKNF